MSTKILRAMPPEMRVPFRIARDRLRAPYRTGEDEDTTHLLALWDACDLVRRWRRLKSDRQLKATTVIQALFAAIGDARRFDASAAHAVVAVGWRR